MNVLLTGGNGFLGRSVLPYLLDAGHAVTAVVRSRLPQQEGGEEARAYWFLGDLADPDLYRHLPRSMDVVIHGATRQGVSEGRYDLLVQDNLLATAHLVRYAVEVGVKKLIYLSSVSVHGTVETERIDENTPVVNPSPYGVTKYAGERLLADVAVNLPTVVLRLPGVLGPGAHHRLWLMQLLSSVLSHDPVTLYNPDTPFNNAVHVHDLGRFFVSLLHQTWQGFYAMPLGAATSLTVWQVADYLIHKTGSRSRMIVQEGRGRSFWIDSSLARHVFGFNQMTIEEILNCLIEERVGQCPLAVSGATTLSL